MKARFNNKDYYFSVSLINSIGQVQILTQAVIRHLSIKENILSPWVEGTIIIDNPINFLDQLSETSLPFSFQKNCRDIISIRIMQPITGDDADFETEEYKRIYMLSYDFIIADSKDVIVNGKLCKQLQLKDVDQFLLEEDPCKIFSSLLTTNQGNILRSNNKDRQVKTGVLIKEIIKQRIPSIKLSDSFDEGSSSMYFNSSGSMSYMDALQYIRKYHAGEQYQDPCILKSDTYLKEYIHVPISRLFNNHKDHVAESIIWSQGGVTSSEMNEMNRWNFSPISYGDDSVISSSSIIDPGANYNKNIFCTHSTGSISKSNNTIIIDNNAANVERMQEKFNSLFVSPFALLHNNKSVTNVNINNQQKIGASIHIENSSETPRISNESGANDLLGAFLYMNTGYKFSLRGSTHRRSMIFTDVISPSYGSEFTAKHCGRHFVTYVEHIFSGMTYVNNIETIKTYQLSK